MPPTTVDIWLVPIPARFDADEERQLLSVLSDEERDRLRQMGSASRQNEYLLGHALARVQLARILQVEPARVPFVFVDGKRPMVAVPGYDGPVYLSGDGGITMGGAFLSLSHSSSFMALAVTTVPVGIDIEPIRARRLTTDLAAAQTFTDPELGSYRALSVDDRALRYAQLWALHEAMIKGAGEPHDQVRRRFSFEVTGHRGVRVVASGGDGTLGDESWQASLATPDDGQVMAVVARTPVGSGSLIPAIHRETVSGLVATLALITGAAVLTRVPAASRASAGTDSSGGFVVDGTAVRRVEPEADPAPDVRQWDRLFARASEEGRKTAVQRLLRTAEERAAVQGLSRVLTSLRTLEGLSVEKLVPLFRLEGLIASLKRDTRYADLARSMERGEVRLDPIERLLCRVALATRDAEEITRALNAVVGRANGNAIGRAAFSPALGVGIPAPAVGSSVMQVLR